MTSGTDHMIHIIRSRKKKKIHRNKMTNMPLARELTYCSMRWKDEMQYKLNNNNVKEQF